MKFTASNFEGRQYRARRVGDSLTLVGTDSPIEALLAEAMARIPWPAGVEIKKQETIGRYRVDFLIGRRLPGGNVDCLLVVECDGEEFHCPAEDYPRDRFMHIHGAAVMRFTGTELHQDAPKCAGEILEWIDAEIRRASR